MTSICTISRRGISTTSACQGMRNIRKFLLYNKRGTRAFREEQAKNPNFDIPIDKRGVRDTGYWKGMKWVHVPEMVPELIVPSLDNFPLKPYVSYRVNDVGNPKEFTAKVLFNAVYKNKIIEDYKNGKLGVDGESLEPNEHEKLTPEQAVQNARKTGSDIFTVQNTNEYPV